MNQESLLNLQEVEEGLHRELAATQTREEAAAKQKHKADGLSHSSRMVADATAEKQRARADAAEAETVAMRGEVSRLQAELEQQTSLHRSNMALGAELRKNAARSSAEAEASRVHAQEAGDRVVSAEAEAASLREELEKSVTELVRQQAATQDAHTARAEIERRAGASQRAHAEVEAALRASQEALQEAMENDSVASSHHDWVQEQVP